MSFLDQWLGMHVSHFGDEKLIDAKLQPAQLLCYKGFSDTWYFGVMALQQKKHDGQGHRLHSFRTYHRGTGPNIESGVCNVVALSLRRLEGLFCNSHYEIAPLC